MWGSGLSKHGEKSPLNQKLTLLNWHFIWWKVSWGLSWGRESKEWLLNLGSQIVCRIQRIEFCTILSSNLGVLIICVVPSSLVILREFTGLGEYF